MFSPNDENPEAIRRRILNFLSECASKPFKFMKLSQILDEYMELWDDYDTSLRNGIIDKNFDFCEAGLVVQNCSFLYSRNLHHLSKYSYKVHETLVAALTGVKPQEDINERTNERENQNEQDILDRRREAQENNPTNENIAEPQPEKAPQENEENHEEHADENDEIFSQPLENYFSMPDENENLQEELPQESVENREMLEMNSLECDQVTLGMQFHNKNEIEMYNYYNTYEPIKPCSLYDYKGKLMEHIETKHLFFLHTFPLRYKIFMENFKWNQRTLTYNNDDMNALTENSTILDKVAVVLLTPLTLDVLERYKQHEKSTDVQPKKCVTPHNFDLRKVDLSTPKFNIEDCVLKPHEIKKRRIATDEKNKDETKKAKLFKPFSVSLDAFEEFYDRNYIFQFAEGLTMANRTNMLTSINRMPTKSFDSGRYSMGILGSEGEMVDTLNSSGYDSGICMTPYSTPRAENHSSLKKMFPNFEDNEGCRQMFGYSAEDLKRLKLNVLEWKLRMREIFAVKKKSNFDIHEYEDKILNSFRENSDIVPFKSLIKNKNNSEISRIFSASLQLANSNNIDIINPTPGEICNDTMELKFLSNVRHHTLLDHFQAPSEELFNERLAAVPSTSSGIATSTPLSSKRSYNDSDRNTPKSENVKKTKLMFS